MQIEESEAEVMKLKYGSASTENSDIDNTINYPLDDDRTVPSRKFVEIVEARLEEIIENVWYQVPSEYADKLLGGIVLTGGGANMHNIKKAFHNHTHVEKIRVAKFVNQTITSSNKLINSHDGRMNTLLGLLAKGDMNCAGGEFDASGNLFGNDKKAGVTTADVHRVPRSNDEIAKGVVLTAAEKAKKEEELRRKREEEERRKREEEEERRRKEEEERRRNSPIRKFGRKIKNFLGGMMDPEDE